MKKTRKDLIADIEAPQARLADTEEVVRAAQSGDADGPVASGPCESEAAITLRGAERLYCLILEEMSEGAVTLSADGVILYCNKRFASILKLSHENLTGSYISQHVAQQDQPVIGRLLKVREPQSKAEITLQTSDGSNLHVLVSTNFVTIDGTEVIYQIVTDLTEQKRNELALRQSEERFQTVARATNDVVWDWDLTSGHVWWNERFYPQFRYTGHEVAPGDGTWADKLHPGDVDRVIAGVNAIFEAHELFWSDEYRFRRADGSYAHVLDRGYVKYNASGEPLRMIGSMMDITERMRVEKELVANAEKLERTNRELQDFAYVASHDLQEPLRKIIAFGDRLKSQSASVLNTDALSYLERMQNAASRMQELIDDLLVYSQITTEAQPFTRVNLGKVAREVLSDLEISIERAEGHVEVGELPTIAADPVQMRQLLQNLIGNALKYHKKGVSPVVKVHSYWESAKDQEQTPRKGKSATRRRIEAGDTTTGTTSTNETNDQCRIIVEDNGIGFDEKYVDRIFTPFERLHSRAEYEGTGIGLAVCRKIVEHHGGSITAKSVPGQGAKFIVTLPANRELANNQLPGELDQCTPMSSSLFQY